MKTSDLLPPDLYVGHVAGCRCEDCRKEFSAKFQRGLEAERQVSRATTAKELADLLDCNCGESTDALCKTSGCSAATHHVAARFITLARNP